ncbi:MAG: DUF3802 family protein [Colwellia sp.]|nr:DUF3802 family protein [Colwellia sp.]
MVTDTDGYIQIIEYLTEHLSLFENSTAPKHAAETVMSTIEVELCDQIINVCSQNSDLTFNQRNAIIREVDAIVHDLEEILSGVINNPVNAPQQDFIREFAGLIKNLFDTVIHKGSFN